MENVFNEFVNQRCGEALLNNKEYMEKENSGKVSEDELQCMAENICYKQGVKDVLYFLSQMTKL